jgi:transposase
MRDIDFFSRLLALQRPWRVEDVTIQENLETINIVVDHRINARFRCPECGVVLPLYDHTPLRKWRHLDHGSWLTWLQARIPRVECLFHGVRQVALPWALPGSRFSLYFENHAIDTLLEADVTGAARLLRLSWDETWGIMERAVRRGRLAKTERIIERLGVDEKAAAKGHRYITLVCDLDRGTVEFIADDRKKASLDSYYQSLSATQLAGIKAVAMDMWEPYFQSTLEHVPAAATKIVFDRFHIMQHMTKAVDEVRRSEHRRLRAEGDETLTRTKYLWLHSEENVPERHAAWFAELKTSKLQTARSWAIKESLRVLWSYQRKVGAQRFWARWYFWATHSRLQPVIKVARLVKNHLANVLTYCDHGITNAVSEGLNSKIQTVKKTPMDFEIESISRSPSTFIAAAWTCMPRKLPFSGTLRCHEDR